MTRPDDWRFWAARAIAPIGDLPMSEIAAGGAAPAPRIETSGNGGEPPGRPIPPAELAANARADADLAAEILARAEAAEAEAQEHAKGVLANAAAAVAEARQRLDADEARATAAEAAAASSTP